EIEENEHGEMRGDGGAEHESKKVRPQLAEADAEKEHSPDVVNEVGRRQDPGAGLRPEREHRDGERDPAGEHEDASDELHDRTDLAKAKDRRREERADRVEGWDAEDDDDRCPEDRGDRR